MLWITANEALVAIGGAIAPILEIRLLRFKSLSEK